MTSQLNGCSHFFVSFLLIFLKLIVAYQLFAMYVREDNNSNVKVMITLIIWMTWPQCLMSIKLNHSLELLRVMALVIINCAKPSSGTLLIVNLDFLWNLTYIYVLLCLSVLVSYWELDRFLVKSHTTVCVTLSKCFCELLRVRQISCEISHIFMCYSVEVFL